MLAGGGPRIGGLMVIALCSLLSRCSDGGVRWRGGRGCDGASFAICDATACARRKSALRSAIIEKTGSWSFDALQRRMRRGSNAFLRGCDNKYA